MKVFLIQKQEPNECAEIIGAFFDIDEARDFISKKPLPEQEKMSIKSIKVI